ncbi:MAG: T9SS type A sorting domain-containing protein [Flavobacteriia bacterium]|nr:T9SS type A sorting domain-containing protein [Flavobacteriia bacterium]
MSGVNISDLTGLQDFASLISLNLSYNQITEIFFHPNVNIGFLILNNNPISEIDLSSHSQLSEMSLSNTNITTLDLSNNPNLRYFYCGNTPILELDLSNNPNLREIVLYGGNFEIVDLRNGNNQNIISVNFLNNPNLPFILVDDCNYSTNNWTDVDPEAIFIENEGDTSCLLGINDVELKNEIDLFPNPNSGVVFLKNYQNLDIDRIYLTDFSGKNIKTFISNFEKLDIANLNSGTYLLKIHLKPSKVITKKIIKR